MMQTRKLQIGLVISVPPEDCAHGNPFEMLFRLVWRYAKAHRRVDNQWQNGEPVSCWYDNNGNICIEYESGVWWHYRVTKQEGLVWWQ